MIPAARIGTGFSTPASVTAPAVPGGTDSP
jgi:hypothetical protein